MNYNFAMCFFKAQMNFVKKFNIKFINWEAKSDKVRSALPKWREDAPESPPTMKPNFYSKELCHEISEGNITFNGSLIKSEMTDFVTEGEKYVEQLKSRFNKGSSN